MIDTSSPCSRSVSARCDPMKPAPPVINARTTNLRGGIYRGMPTNCSPAGTAPSAMAESKVSATRRPNGSWVSMRPNQDRTGTNPTFRPGPRPSSTTLVRLAQARPAASRNRGRRPSRVASPGAPTCWILAARRLHPEGVPLFLSGQHAVAVARAQRLHHAVDETDGPHRMAGLEQHHRVETVALVLGDPLDTVAEDLPDRDPRPSQFGRAQERHVGAERSRQLRRAPAFGADNHPVDRRRVPPGLDGVGEQRLPSEHARLGADQDVRLAHRDDADGSADAPVAHGRSPVALLWISSITLATRTARSSSRPWWMP